ncbi:hydrogenase-4 component E [Pseudoroseomonas cervicalis]|uniref:hydrogenase-4 component E n=1 Tax=Teichococcus cervicalis TaxID=204525 RepID=UPI0022F1D3BB|nr:hydrogenase-4 component E [Pseudoroseomonas cervicalis]WBV43958.1 hydrogenase-4 component E [Pseudoroseomonas cervicalis]
MSPWSQDVVNLLGGLVLLVGFALLPPRRLPALTGLMALQGGLAALALGWQALLLGDAGLLGLATLAGLAKAVLIPWALRRLAPPLSLPAAPRGTAWPLLAGLALVVLACLAVLPAGAAAPMGEALSWPRAAREDLAIALSVLLLGLLLLVLRRHPASLAAGLLGLENGLTLLAAELPGLRLAAALPGLALLALAAASLWLLLGPGAAKHRAALWRPPAAPGRDSPSGDGLGGGPR